MNNNDGMKAVLIVSKWRELFVQRIYSGVDSKIQRKKNKHEKNQ